MIVPAWLLDLPLESQGLALQKIRAREVRRLRNLVRYRRQFTRRAPSSLSWRHPDSRPLTRKPHVLVPLKGAFSLEAIAREVWQALGPSGFSARAQARRAKRNAIAAASRRANRR